MPVDDAATMEKVLEEGSERLVHWHQQAEQKANNSNQTTAVETAETSNTSSVTAPMPDFTNLNISEDNKQKAAAFKDKGNAFYKKSDYVQAIEAYSQGLTLDPTNHIIYSNRSACYLALQQLDACLKDAEICRRLVPHWLKGCFRLATARFALGLYEDAAVAAYEGLQLDEGNEELKSLLQRAVKKGQQEHKAKLAGGEA